MLHDNDETWIKAISYSISASLGYLWMVLLKTLSSLWSNATSRLRPVMIFTRLKFDETPTKVRLVEPCFDSENSTACLDEMPGVTSSSLHTKVMQIEFAMGMLAFDTETDQYTWIFGELPTALRAIQSTNGITTFKCLKDAINSVPGLLDFAWEQDFKLHVRHCCSDSYSANFVAERLLKQDMPSWISADTVCDVHRFYTATKTAMSTVDYDISGLLNLSLALSGAGTVSTLRKILARIFGRRLTIIYEQAPTETMGSPAQMYQQELFDTFLPTTGVDSARRTLNEKRRFVLSYYLNGNLGPNQKVIEHWCVFGLPYAFSNTQEFQQMGDLGSHTRFVASLSTVPVDQLRPVHRLDWSPCWIWTVGRTICGILWDMQLPRVLLLKILFQFMMTIVIGTLSSKLTSLRPTSRLLANRTARDIKPHPHVNIQVYPLV